MNTIILAMVRASGWFEEVTGRLRQSTQTLVSNGHLASVELRLSRTANVATRKWPGYARTRESNLRSLRKLTQDLQKGRVREETEKRAISLENKSIKLIRLEFREIQRELSGYLTLIHSLQDLTAFEETEVVQDCAKLIVLVRESIIILEQYFHHSDLILYLPKEVRVELQNWINQVVLSVHNFTEAMIESLETEFKVIRQISRRGASSTTQTKTLAALLRERVVAKRRLHGNTTHLKREMAGVSTVLAKIEKGIGATNDSIDERGSAIMRVKVAAVELESNVQFIIAIMQANQLPNPRVEKRIIMQSATFKRHAEKLVALFAEEHPVQAPTGLLGPHQVTMKEVAAAQNILKIARDHRVVGSGDVFWKAVSSFSQSVGTIHSNLAILEEGIPTEMTPKDAAAIAADTKEIFRPEGRIRELEQALVDIKRSREECVRVRTLIKNFGVKRRQVSRPKEVNKLAEKIKLEEKRIVSVKQSLLDSLKQKNCQVNLSASLLQGEREDMERRVHKLKSEMEQAGYDIQASARTSRLDPQRRVYPPEAHDLSRQMRRKSENLSLLQRRLLAHRTDTSFFNEVKSVVEQTMATFQKAYRDNIALQAELLSARHKREGLHERTHVGYLQTRGHILMHKQELDKALRSFHRGLLGAEAKFKARTDIAAQVIHTGLLLQSKLAKAVKATEADADSFVAEAQKEFSAIEKSSTGRKKMLTNQWQKEFRAARQRYTRELSLFRREVRVPLRLLEGKITNAELTELNQLRAKEKRAERELAQLGTAASTTAHLLGANDAHPSK